MLGPSMRLNVVLKSNRVTNLVTRVVTQETANFKGTLMTQIRLSRSLLSLLFMIASISTFGILSLPVQPVRADNGLKNVFQYCDRSFFPMRTVFDAHDICAEHDLLGKWHSNYAQSFYNPDWEGHVYPCVRVFYAHTLNPITPDGLPNCGNGSIGVYYTPDEEQFPGFPVASWELGYLTYLPPFDTGQFDVRRRIEAVAFSPRGRCRNKLCV
jgi:hypothetical protein